MENTTLVALNLMERRGWVRRRRDKEDRRRLRVYLTDKGRAIHKLRPVVLEANRAAVRELGQREIEQTRHALKTMLASLEDALDEAMQKPKKKASRRAKLSPPAVPPLP
jgi:DNA-binding MarR family transcriptional regulator